MKVKICGLKTPEALAAAAEAGAAWAGFVFFDRSPRNLSFAEAAPLAASAPPGLTRVALTVNPSDDFLDALTRSVPIDMLQLHGSEPPERVAEIRVRYGLMVMKAVGVAEEADLDAIDTYGAVADRLLIDAKPPKDAARPGGNALAFDWTLLEGRRWSLPWMLAGGLTAETVGLAARLTGAEAVDVSSGVESAPGVKDPALIRAFIAAAMA